MEMTIDPDLFFLFGRVKRNKETAAQSGSSLPFDRLQPKSVPMGASLFSSGPCCLLHGLNPTSTHGECSTPPSRLKNGFFAFLLSKNEDLLNENGNLS
jgi:hypothetical protein